MKLQHDTTGHTGVAGVTPPGERPDDRPLPAADATALSLVGLLVFCVACFVWGAAVLSRRERRAFGRPESEDAAQANSHSAERKPGQPLAPWEREPDWWKE